MILVSARARVFNNLMERKPKNPPPRSKFLGFGQCLGKMVTIPSTNKSKIHPDQLVVLVLLM